MKRQHSLVLWCARLLAVTCLFLAMWIVVPAPNRLLLPLAVGAPEVSVWLLTLGVLALALVAPRIRRERSVQLVALVAVTGIGLSALPLVQFSSVATRAERAMRTALGGAYLSQIPRFDQQHFRATSLSLTDLFFGFRTTPSVITITRDIPFHEVSGTALTLDLYQPADTGLRPVLVQIYGGAWQRGVPGDHAEFASYFAQRGYVVVAIDYRHAPTFTFPSQLDDVRYALAWIGANSQQLRADTSRMVLIGRSAGAHLAMLAAYATDAPHIRGVVDFYGPVDLIEGYEHPPQPDPLQVQHIEEAFLGGTPSNMIERYREASPISLVTRQLPPTLLLYGARDHVVEARFGALLAGRLRAEGTTVVHVEIPWAEHAFDAVPHGPSGQLSRYVAERFIAWVVNNDQPRLP